MSRRPRTYTDRRETFLMIVSYWFGFAVGVGLTLIIVHDYL